MTMHGVQHEDTIHLDRERNRIVQRRSFRLLLQLLGPMRWSFALVLVVATLAQAARAAGPIIVASAINSGLPQLQAGRPDRLLLDGGLYLLAAVGGGVLTLVTIRLSAWISQVILHQLRLRIFDHTQKLSMEFHEWYTSGRIISRQTSDLESVRELLEAGVTRLFSGFLFMGFVAIGVFVVDWKTGLILLAASVPVYLLTRWFQRKSQLYYRSTRVASANLIVHFIESVSGIRAVQAFRRQRPTTERHAELSEEFRVADTRAIGLVGVYDPGLVLIGNLTVAAVLLIDGFRVFDGELPIGTLVAAVLYAKRFFQPVEQMARFYTSLQSAIAALEKISGLLEERPSVAEPTEPVPLDSATGSIAYEGVSFAYGDAGTVLPEFDLVIPAGQTVAVVGATGAGKSTLAKLLARFYDVSTGRITLDGIDVRDISNDDLRRAMVMVTQDSFLFSGTIAENIALGRPDATREEIIAAASAVGVDRFVNQLPDGYDTDVHKRGGRLSAGQRQLVSFARAFLADPAVLILDEATSSLDLPSERLVQRGLQRLLAGRTAIIIAHRLSTIEIADRVLVVDDGRIVEDGSPADLAATGGEYARLHAQWLAATA